MNTPRFVFGPYSEFSRRLKTLHSFIRDGEGDSDKAEAIRDEMDDDYSRLTPGEIERLEFLSADLNWLSEIDRLQDRRPTATGLHQELLLAVSEEAWAILRSLLTAGASHLGESDGLLFRSIYWLGLGDIESSLVFLETLGNRLESQSIDIESKRTILETWMNCQGCEDRAILEKAEVFEELAGWVIQMVGRALEETRRLIEMVRALDARKAEERLDSQEWSLLKQQISKVEACTWASPGRAA